ncbi:MAG: hypoxanthine phosphoribosyltransferase [Oligoflexia bacterium]|nr:hypoxanthine phosphoribosyltransferase [Oligoflexia bacterium]
MTFAIEKTLPYITQDEINEVCRRLGKQIESDYRDKNLLIICILKGSFIFTADLIRHINLPLSVEFVQLSSYGSSKTSSGQIKIVKDITSDVKGRDVLVVEDILDTGSTLNRFREHLMGHGPKSVRICALLDKPSKRVAQIQADYVGRVIDDLFVVGYGLDFSETYRNLPEIRYLPD